MPGMRTLRFAAIGISLLVPMAQSAAQEALPSPLDPAGQELAENNFQEANRASEGEEPRSPFEDHIETDRDAFTPATRTAPVNRWIMESSYSFIDNRGIPDTNSFPELLVRYGLFKRLELRLGWNYEAGAGGSVVSGESGEAAEGVDTSHLTREQRLLYGLKASLTEQESWRPDSIAILQGYTPTGGAATATQLVATYAFGWRLPNRWRFDSSYALPPTATTATVLRSGRLPRFCACRSASASRFTPSILASSRKTARATSARITSVPACTI